MNEKECKIVLYFVWYLFAIVALKCSNKIYIINYGTFDSACLSMNKIIKKKRIQETHLWNLLLRFTCIEIEYNCTVHGVFIYHFSNI